MIGMFETVLSLSAYSQHPLISQCSFYECVLYVVALIAIVHLLSSWSHWGKKEEEEKLQT